MSIQFGFIKPKYTLQYFMIAQHSVKLEVKMPTSLDQVQKLFCGPSRWTQPVKSSVSTCWRAWWCFKWNIYPGLI